MAAEHESKGTPDDRLFTALFLAAEQTQLPHEPQYDVDAGLRRFDSWLDEQAGARRHVRSPQSSYSLLVPRWRRQARASQRTGSLALPVPWPSIQSVGKIAGVAIAAGGGAGLAKLAAASKSTVAVVALTVIIVSAIIISGLPKIVDSIYKRRAAIIEKENIGQVMRREVDMRRRIAEAGLDPDKTESAIAMLRQLAINPVLPKDRRLSDETYREWLRLDKPKSVNGKLQPPKGGVVLPFPERSDD